MAVLLVPKKRMKDYDKYDPFLHKRRITYIPFLKQHVYVRIREDKNKSYHKSHASSTQFARYEGRSHLIKAKRLIVFRVAFSS